MVDGSCLRVRLGKTISGVVSAVKLIRWASPNERGIRGTMMRPSAAK